MTKDQLIKTASESGKGTWLGRPATRCIWRSAGRHSLRVVARFWSDGEITVKVVEGDSRKPSFREYLAETKCDLETLIHLIKAGGAWKA